MPEVREALSPRRKDAKGDGSSGSFVELIVIVAVAVGLAILVQAYLVKPYRIPSSSMEPTLDIGQRVLVNRAGTHFGDPSVGDILVFHPPAGADGGSCAAPAQGEGTRTPCARSTAARSKETYIKRVVGIGGDRISIRDGHVIRNGKPEKDAYIRACGGGPNCTFPRAITVPHGDFYMMGDNRGDSEDSRFWGPVPKKWIIGRAFATYWPPDRIGIF